jgi:site-specific DNA-adenine methylase
VQASFGCQGRNFGRSTRTKSQAGSKLKNNLKLFPPLHGRLKNVQIENSDWRLILKDYDYEEAVFYIDPPYYTYSKGQYELEMRKEEHEELLSRIFEMKAFVALSGYHNELYDQSRWTWDHRYVWKVQVSQLGMAFTETNNLAGHEGENYRGTTEEVLWVKEAD